MTGPCATCGRPPEAEQHTDPLGLALLGFADDFDIHDYVPSIAEVAR